MRVSSTIALTGNGSRRHHRGLKPHLEEVRDGKVTKAGQEITGTNEDGNFLFEQKQCQDGFDSEFQFDD